MGRVPVPSEAMMRCVPVSLILRWVVLTGYALLVALGHGGWHLAAGDGGCAGHTHTNHSLTGCSSHIGTAPATCCHRHAGQHSHSSGSPAPQAPVPTPHDSDHCSVCAVFCAPLTLATVVEVAFSVVEFQVVAEWHTVVLCSAPDLVSAPRGPPAC